MEYSVYEDMAKRTNGDIYVGVVGPVRTGKSTFIQKFMQELVLPYLDSSLSVVATDELPQSASGRTVMTTEPKFVPSEAAALKIGKEASVKVRLIDCVGFPVEGAEGFKEEGNPRYIKTPWRDSPMPFAEAAELGTKKVICDHSTVGVLVTTDGSVTGILRESYEPAERKAVAELTAIGKPFVIVLNSSNPDGAACKDLKERLQSEYGAPVIAFNVEQSTAEELQGVLQTLLYEFPLHGFDICLPRWIQSLPPENPAVADCIARARTVAPRMKKMRDVDKIDAAFADSEWVEGPMSVQIFPGEGRAEIGFAAKEGVFYSVLSSECGEKIDGDCELMRYVCEIAKSRRTYEKLSEAYLCAKETGYGIVLPCDQETRLASPEATRQGGKHGIRLKATSPSYHILKIDVENELTPIVGGESGGEELVREMVAGYADDPEKLWGTNLFGKSLKTMVSEGLAAKSTTMPDEAKRKMRRTVERITNEGRGGVICILL